MRTFRAIAALVIAFIAQLAIPSSSIAEGVLVCGERILGETWCGYRYNYRSVAEAQTAAITACRAEPPSNCRITASFRNSCHGHAFSQGGGWGASGGADLASAQRAAIAACRRYNPGQSCILHATVCDTVDGQEVLRAEAEQRHQEAKARAQAEQAARERAEAEAAEREERRRARQAELERQREAELERQREAKAQQERTYQFNLGLCEQYDLSACTRISATPLVVPGSGIAKSLDDITARNMRFNAALENARKFARYLAECAARQRIAGDAALAMPNLAVHHRAQIQQMQLALPWYDLDDPNHFVLTLFGVPLFGGLLFTFLARRSPARGTTGFLPRARSAVRSSLMSLRTVSLANIRMRLASLIAPELAANPATNAPGSRAIVLPPPPPLRDPIAARAALELAHAYLREVPLDKIVGNPDAAAGHRSTLALAAKQLEIAQRADPGATLVIAGEGGRGETVTQQRLRAHVLLLEGLTWSHDNPRKEIRLLTQATEIDPAYAPAFHSLGLAHFYARNRGAAIAALERALALEPGNIEIIKQLDRARNMSDAEIATFKVTNAAARTAAAGVRTWNILRLIWAIGLPLGIVLIVAQFTDSMSKALGIIVGVVAISAIFTGLRRLKHWYDTF
jgi:tetratricopeptide (TPR) repeat protein